MHGAPPPPAIAPGTLLAGKYRVERVLGQGAMGVVVAARHVELGELFAIKLLVPGAFSHLHVVERFLREARAAAKLKSEHVVRVTDVGRLHDGSPYMVMEHLAGTDLQKHVRIHGPLPVTEAITYMQHVCDAVAEAHAGSIVHRDLKPANLFLTRKHNGAPCVKVLDFGISKQQTREDVDLTRTGDVFGSPVYMAPEQMARTKNADARSDIWSLGVVLYELLTGTTPFHATTITEVIARVLQEDPAPPSSIRGDLPEAVDAIVMRCLQKRPEHRFQSVQQLSSALEATTRADARSSSEASRLSAPFPAADSSSRSAGQLPSVVLPQSVPSTLTLLDGAQAGPPAATGSSWAKTASHRKRGPGGLVVFLAVGGVLAALVVVAAGWLALRSSPSADPQQPPSPGPSASGVFAERPSTDPPVSAPAGSTMHAAQGAPASSTDTPPVAASAPSAAPKASGSQSVPKKVPGVPPSTNPRPKGNADTLF